ncbi:HNH endonuclease [Xanthomonas sp. CFBP 8445]|uniref:HNH endonuclease n=1 Tax=Xanthomonas sp. CFBP 8445 TaxID=2971236 RepID=UPI0021E0155B|nr:HNH endonuclease [Xanthomonas sp. CFBP 8445]UYC14029.1 HNH endonuclease [Xanthomonas sp. CFBP 8445]
MIRAIVFSDDAINRISAIRADPAFDHRMWADESLELVRCEIRDHYRRAQLFRCVYCLNPLAVRAAVGSPVEHIAPKSIYLNYMFEPLNLCVCCPDCNEYKSNREVHADPPVKGRVPVAYPEDPGSFRIVHPHFDDYSEHIRRAGILYIPFSEKGSYTIYVCNLGRYLNELGMSEELFNDLNAVMQRHQFHER